MEETPEKDFFPSDSYMNDLKNNVLKEVVQTCDYHTVANKYKIPMATMYSWIKLAGLTPRNYNSNLKDHAENKRAVELEELKRENALYKRANGVLGSKVRRIYEILGE